MCAEGGCESPADDDVKLRDTGWNSPVGGGLLVEVTPPKFGT